MPDSNYRTILKKVKLWRQKDQGLPGVNREGGKDRGAQRISRVVKTTLNDTIMVDTCHYTFPNPDKLHQQG